MPCTLSLRLDRDPATFEAGERILGYVSIVADEAMSCERLQVLTEWFVEGTGDRADGSIETVDIGAVSVAAGSPSEHRFELRAPPEPRAYEGHLFALRLRLRGKAHVAGTSTSEAPTATCPIEVVHPTNPHGYEVQPAELVHEANAWKMLAVSTAMLLGLPLAVGAGVLDVPVVPALGAISGLLGAIGFALSWSLFRAERRTGRVHLQVEQAPGAGYRDGPASESLRISLQSGAQQAEASVKLEVEELTGQSFGGDSIHRHHELFSAQETLQETSAGVRTCELPLPARESVPRPIDRGRNRVSWTLVLTIANASGAGLIRRLPLDVR